MHHVTIDHSTSALYKTSDVLYSADVLWSMVTWCMCFVMQANVHACRSFITLILIGLLLTKAWLLLLPPPAFVPPDASSCSYTASTRQVTCSLGVVAPGAPAKAVWIVMNVVASAASHTYSLSGTTAINGPVIQPPAACTVTVVSIQGSAVRICTRHAA
jgi:hypothetical protein